MKGCLCVPLIIALLSWFARCERRTSREKWKKTAHIHSIFIYRMKFSVAIWYDWLAECLVGWLVGWQQTSTCHTTRSTIICAIWIAIKCDGIFLSLESYLLLAIYVLAFVTLLFFLLSLRRLFYFIFERIVSTSSSFFSLMWSLPPMPFHFHRHHHHIKYFYLFIGWWWGMSFSSYLNGIYCFFCFSTCFHHHRTHFQTQFISHQPGASDHFHFYFTIVFYTHKSVKWIDRRKEWKETKRKWASE